MLHIVQKLTVHESADPSDLEGLNRALSGGPMILHIAESDSVFRLESTLLQAGWSRIRAEIAASFGAYSRRAIPPACAFAAIPNHKSIIVRLME